ncbi:hypothetical protein E1100_25710 [Vibrio owensii]|uniref:hypothetical protein n=1 Tax=Vibrio owensii TaxID=696485 RepID=UPI001042EC6B|nr:hypothetical protein [Vibrio owensii]TDE19259.1 hypothetical protein E1100_25710 [Vibrio owensii]
MEGHRGRIATFWQSQSGKVYFRLYGEPKPFLIGDGVGEDLVPWLAKNLGVCVNANDCGEFHRVSWFSVTSKVVLRRHGAMVAWQNRALPAQWKQVAKAPKRRQVWLSEQDYNGYYEPLLKV